MPWKKLLANVTGSIDEELRLRNEYLVTENRILRSKIKGRLRLKDEERRQLATIGKKLGRKALEAIATIVKPDTILRWHAKLVARKFDGSSYHRTVGRPPLSPEIEALILIIARENKNWGYDRISGALKNLGHRVSDATVSNILKKHGLPPALDRKRETTWTEFINTHMDVLVATDFFSRVSVCLPITFCSSFIWVHARCTSEESRRILISGGLRRSYEISPMSMTVY